MQPRKHVLIALALLPLLLAPIAPLAEETTEATVITYDVPIWVQMNGTATVAANATETLNFSMPFALSDTAQVLMHYTVNTTNCKLQLAADGNNITEISLAAGATDAIVPLTVKPSENLTVSIVSLGDDVHASVTITVLDGARWQVVLQPSSRIQIPQGGQAEIKVIIKQVSGPGGTLFLRTYTSSSAVHASVKPTQLDTTGSGCTRTVYWYFSVDKLCAPGNYQATLKGKFTPNHIPGMLSGTTEYTFAEVTLPIEIAASGAGGFMLGALAGHSLGMWAVGIGVLLVLIVIAVMLRK